VAYFFGQPCTYSPQVWWSSPSHRTLKPACGICLRHMHRATIVSFRASPSRWCQIIQEHVSATCTRVVQMMTKPTTEWNTDYNLRTWTPLTPVSAWGICRVLFVSPLRTAESRSYKCAHQQTAVWRTWEMISYKGLRFAISKTVRESLFLPALWWLFAWQKEQHIWPRDGWLGCNGTFIT